MQSIFDVKIHSTVALCAVFAFNYQDWFEGNYDLYETKHVGLINKLKSCILMLVVLKIIPMLYEITIFIKVVIA